MLLKDFSLFQQAFRFILKQVILFQFFKIYLFPAMQPGPFGSGMYTSVLFKWHLNLFRYNNLAGKNLLEGMIELSLSLFSSLNGCKYSFNLKMEFSFSYGLI